MWRKRTNRYKKSWYGYIAFVCLHEYGNGKLQSEGTAQSGIMLEAIETAIAETRGKLDGELIIELVTMVYIKRTHKLSQAADLLHIGERTAQKLASDFVYLVGKKAGYDFK